MSGQLDLFREREARDRGMGLAAESNEENLEITRAVAAHLAGRDGRVTINEVRTQCRHLGYDLEWGNWTGSIFKGSEWLRVGYTQAKHEGSHARTVGIWRLK